MATASCLQIYMHKEYTYRKGKSKCFNESYLEPGPGTADCALNILLHSPAAGTKIKEAVPGSGRRAARQSAPRRLPDCPAGIQSKIMRKGLIYAAAGAVLQMICYKGGAHDSGH